MLTPDDPYYRRAIKRRLNDLKKSHAPVCGHPEGDIVDGPRVPMRWGSGPTQVCGLCGWWRNTLHIPGPWFAPPIKTEPDDDV